MRPADPEVAEPQDRDSGNPRHLVSRSIWLKVSISFEPKPVSERSKSSALRIGKLRRENLYVQSAHVDRAVHHAAECFHLRLGPGVAGHHADLLRPVERLEFELLRLPKIMSDLFGARSENDFTCRAPIGPVFPVKLVSRHAADVQQ